MGLDVGSTGRTRQLEYTRDDLDNRHGVQPAGVETGQPSTTAGPRFQPTVGTSTESRERFRFESGASLRAWQIHSGYEDRSPPDTSWWKGRPLVEGRNAHTTNTKEDFQAALDSDANWFEGDVRQEINSDTLEMRHNEGHDSGDNMTLEEWLRRGKESGRGLKLDLKETEHLDRILAEVEASGVPDERLMFNLGADREKLDKIRAKFPDAILAINPSGGDGPLSQSEIDKMIGASEAGGPVTFVVRYDRLDQNAIDQLRGHGTISIWNDPGRGGLSEEDIPRVTQELREKGVLGLIDLRPSKSNLEKAGDVVEGAKNKLRDWLT